MISRQYEGIQDRFFLPQDDKTLNCILRRHNTIFESRFTMSLKWKNRGVRGYNTIKAAGYLFRHHNMRCPQFQAVTKATQFFKGKAQRKKEILYG
jgi:hypothetical protein